jgi:hypothetical protein
VGRFGGSEWFVWTMSYPQGKPTRVHVAYEQKLDEQVDSPWYLPVVHASYVLRTGALWAGSIGHAKVTFVAPNGGGFVGADHALEASSDRIVWDFEDFKPTFDLDTAYIYAGPWQELQAAETAATAENASPEANLRAAQAVLRVLGTRGSYAQPPALVQRYADAMRQWAWKATSLDTAPAWEALGDVEHYAASPSTKNHGELSCWPEAGAAAYERAAELGSASAAEKRADLDDTVTWMQSVGLGTPPACG